MKHLLAAALVCAGYSVVVPAAFAQSDAQTDARAGSAASAAAPIYDTIIGDAGTLATPTAHWFTVAGREIAYIIDGDAGTVEGTLTLSRFSPALEPHLASQRIFSYGSFYSRNVYGDRTDVVQTFDLSTTLPVAEVEIPPKSAGIGHAGMIGLIEDRFIGVWNITPAMSVSVVDTADQSFIGEISTPGCAGVYPVDAGFLMACGDGRLQYLRLDGAGREVDRVRSEAFFSISEDPVFDYAVETATGWMFLSLDGHVFEATVSNGAIQVSEPWSINPTDIPDAADLNGVPIAADDDWRIGGRQPFAYNAANKLLVTLMHQGGGQETFEDPGTQVWAFDTQLQRRAYVLELDPQVPAASVELTADDTPLLIIAPDDGGELLIHDARSSRHLRSMSEINASTIQRLQ